MPIHNYYKGDGSKVMGSMKKTYGKDKGKKVFYATASKYGLDPSDDMKKKMIGMSASKKKGK